MKAVIFLMAICFVAIAKAGPGIPGMPDTPTIPKDGFPEMPKGMPEVPKPTMPGSDVPSSSDVPKTDKVPSVAK